MKSKLEEVASQYANLYTEEIIDEVSSVLDEEYGHTLRTTLWEVMFAGNHLTKDETGAQSNFLDVYKKRVDELLDKAGNPQKAIDIYIQEIEARYSGKTTKTTNSFIEEKPIVEWDRATIGFYCNQEGYDASLLDLLFYIDVVDFDDWHNNIESEIKIGEADLVDAGIVGNALHEFSQGVADSLLLRELHKRAVKDFGGPTESVALAELITELRQLRSNILEDNHLLYSASNSMRAKSARPHSSEETTSISTNPNDAHFYILKLSYKLKLLFNKLKQDELIHPSTDFQDFKYVFRYEEKRMDKEYPYNPIIWTGNNEELRWFIKTLINMGIIQPKYGKRQGNRWHVVQYCFRNAIGEIYTPYQLRKTGLLKNSIKIKDAINAGLA